jgi:hypothetical protein
MPWGLEKRSDGSRPGLRSGSWCFELCGAAPRVAGGFARLEGMREGGGGRRIERRDRSGGRDVLRAMLSGCAMLFGCAMLLVGCAMLLVGCASPGPPRPPSLNLPGAVTDLAALRVGNAVEVRFTVPQRNTDHLLLRGDNVTAVLCRGLPGAACVPLPGRQALARLTAGRPTEALLRNGLPQDLTTGAARVVVYQMELLNAGGKTAGFSEPVYALAGAVPPRVTGLRVEGSRLGVILRWDAVAADGGVVTVRREDLSPKPVTTSAPAAGRVKTALPVARAEGEGTGVVWMLAEDDGAANNMPAMLDTTAVAGEAYRYSAERRRAVTLGGQRLEMRSDVSPALGFVLRDTFPPPVPSDLSAAAFAEQGVRSVDLIWQPVEDAGLRGYVVYRAKMGSDGAMGARVRLTAVPVGLPAFHDKGVAAGAYRYAVTAVDLKGNESAAVSVELIVE